MSVKVLAMITEREPWGAPLADPPPVPVERIAARGPVICPDCLEPIVHDGAIWRHVRTGLSAHWRGKQCQPLCRDCGQAAVKAIGATRFDGAGLRFVIDHFLCRACLGKGVYIAHT